MTKTQKTSKDHEIPIPKRGDFLNDLKKITTPKKSGEDSPKKK